MGNTWSPCFSQRSLCNKLPQHLAAYNSHLIMLLYFLSQEFSQGTARLGSRCLGPRLGRREAQTEVTCNWGMEPSKGLDWRDLRTKPGDQSTPRGRGTWPGFLVAASERSSCLHGSVSLKVPDESEEATSPLRTQPRKLHWTGSPYSASQSHRKPKQTQGEGVQTPPPMGGVSSHMCGRTVCYSHL